jgi:hypothetical protein
VTLRVIHCPFSLDYPSSTPPGKVAAGPRVTGTCLCRGGAVWSYPLWLSLWAFAHDGPDCDPWATPPSAWSHSTSTAAPLACRGRPVTRDGLTHRAPVLNSRGVTLPAAPPRLSPSDVQARKEFVEPPAKNKDRSY